ncbi:AraC family transcriptional regulator ligand-binding domain-containing protein [Haliangium sp.]|uniref:AraC family transcriptional regulator n=1 Tax=Haliangium sp. TaxID=2663208 RepID=UPI003D125FCE
MTSNATEDWKRWFIPGVYPMTVLEIAADRGLASKDVLARAGIELGAGEIFESGLTFEQLVHLMEVVEEALEAPEIGVEMGWRLPPTALGSVGYAILSSATAAEALELLQRFWHLVERASVITIDTSAEIGSIELEVRVPMTEHQRIVLKEVCFVSVHRGLIALFPQASNRTEVWFDFPEPPQGSHVRQRLGQVRYDMPACQFRFPTRFLDQPLPMSNPMGLRTAVKWCEREERERGLTDSRLVARVQSELRPGPNGYPSLDQMARRLAMAPRTLRRHLRDEGTRYSTLLEAARRREALRLLDNRSLATHQVAEMLGYEDPANFTRAFRRWTGQTPRQYRSRSKTSTPVAPEHAGE